MNFAKRAFTSVMRRKPKSLILLLIVLILGNIMLSSMLIVQSVEGTKQTILTQLPPIVSLAFEFEKMQQAMEAGTEVTWITFEDLDRIEAASRPYIKSYDYSIRTAMTTESIKRLELEGSFSMPGFTMPVSFMGSAIPSFTYLETGDAQISAGRTFTEQELADGSPVVLMSEELADLNGLSVGDIFTVESQVMDFGGFGQQNAFSTLIYDFKVIGLLKFKELPPAGQGQGQNMELQMQRERVNNIITTNNFIRKYNAAYMEEQNKIFRERGGPVMPTEFNPLIGVTINYVLNSSDEFDTFVKRSTAALGNDFYTFTSQEDNFNKVSRPLESMREILTYALYITLVSSVVVLALVLFAFIRDRQKEIGIYFALGEKKGRIIMQLIVETVTVGLIGATLAVLSGTFIASVISKIMLPAQPVQPAAFQPVFTESFLSNIDYNSVLQKFSIGLTIPSALTFYIAITITIISAQLIASVYILRFDPKKIMM